MKIIAGILVLWALFEAAVVVNSPAAVFVDPLRPITGGAKGRYMSYGTVRPDLSLLKKSIYLPYVVKKDDTSYTGVIAIKVKPKGGHEMSGTLLHEDAFDKTSLLSGEIIEHPTHYEIAVKSRGMAPMMRTKKIYTETKEFPIRLVLRSNGENANPYLTAALDEAGGAEFITRRFTVGTEKLYTGKFAMITSEGKWTFNMQPLGPLQLTGTAYLRSSEGRNLDCGYPLYGFSQGGNHMVILTGEDSNDRSGCGPRGWRAYPDQSEWSEMKPRTQGYNHLNVYRDED
ncbi:MAG TPA: hypothetical protein PL182_13780 [Pseudobdellovibrionaceae bacterium]|nr:hypothetical protein [Pseudobdellovibrionaceae bacterium]